MFVSNLRFENLSLTYIYRMVSIQNVLNSKYIIIFAYWIVIGLVFFAIILLCWFLSVLPDCAGFRPIGRF